MSASELYDTTQKSGKRPNTDIELSPSGTFTLLELSNLMDRKPEPIFKKARDRAIDLENRVKILEEENNVLKEKLVNQEIYSRKENIKVIGMTEAMKKTVNKSYLKF